MRPIIVSVRCQSPVELIRDEFAYSTSLFGRQVLMHRNGEHISFTSRDQVGTMLYRHRSVLAAAPYDPVPRTEQDRVALSQIEATSSIPAANESASLRARRRCFVRCFVTVHGFSKTQMP